MGDGEQSAARHVAEIGRAVARHFVYVVFCWISGRFSQSDRSTKMNGCSKKEVGYAHGAGTSHDRPPRSSFETLDLTLEFCRLRNYSGAVEARNVGVGTRQDRC